MIGRSIPCREREYPVSESLGSFLLGPVYYGRDCYFADVYSLLDSDGNEVHTFALAELANLREVKTWDLTSADIITLMMETTNEKEETSPAW